MIEIVKIEKKPFTTIQYQSSGREGPRHMFLPFFYAEASGLPEGLNTIVATSDLQGRVDGQLLGYKLIEKLLMLQKCEGHIDLLLLAGDLYDDESLKKLGATGPVTNLLNAFALNFDCVIAAHGNHDEVQADKLNSSLIVLDGEVGNLMGLKVGGVCGVIGKPTKNQRKSPDVFFKAFDRVISKSDLIVMHQSPRGESPGQKGDEHTAEIMRNKGHSLIVSGHCNWGESHISLMGRNQILNVDSKVIVIKRAKKRT
ncbi:metallophosphoesterase family protein [Photobacterium leiognathi]|uniref:metallophosphoesterase family protein n=1 Tax=Photobacterium leiognathi TaxID=553611 RepID=UPI002980BABC|nr:metallophosphoesterase [Photobacterium leiognathi]